MAYGIEYQLLCTSKKGNLYTAKIYEDGYSSAEIDRNIPINPFKLRKDEASVVKGTSFDFAIREEVDFEFIKFYTGVGKKFKVELYKESIVIWTGYINTLQYSADYKPAPNNIWFSASDGMGLLKNEKFSMEGPQSEMKIITYCIDKINLGLEYAIAISIWEINHDQDLAVLEQAYQDCEIYEGNDCYSVLEKIIGRYDAEITQVNNRWEIVSSIDKKSSRMIYTPSGVYDSVEAAPSVLSLGYPNDCDVYPINILRHDIKSAGKRIDILHEFGRKDSLLTNYLFTKYSSNMFTTWTKSGSYNVLQKLDNLGFYAYLEGETQVDTDYISQSIVIENAPGEYFNLDFYFCPKQSVELTMAMRYQVSITDGVTTYYLDPSVPEWTTTPTIASVDVTATLLWLMPVWSNVNVAVSELPCSGTLTIKLYRYEHVYMGYIDYAMCFRDVKIRFLTGGELYDEKIEGTATFTYSSGITDLNSFKFSAADAPVTANEKLLYTNIVRQSDNNPTTKWRLSTGDTCYTLIQLYLKLIASKNRVPRQKLSGTLKGSDIPFNCLILHSYNSNREFEIVQCLWDLHAERYDVTLLEVLDYSDQEIVFEDADGTESTIGSPADLDVQSVTLGSSLVIPGASFNITANIQNTGELPGQNTIQWKVVNGSDETQTSGTHESQIIAASAGDNDTFAITAPDTAGSYTVKCKMINDTSWVSSASLTVSETEVAINSIQTIPVGVVDTPLTLTFNATNSGPEGTKTIYYELYDSDDQLVYSGDEDKLFANGTDNYSLTETVYPSTPAIGYYFLVWSEDNPGGAVQSNDFEATAT